MGLCSKSPTKTPRLSAGGNGSREDSYNHSSIPSHRTLRQILLTMKLAIKDCSASAEKSEDDCANNVTTANVDETWRSGKRAPQHIDLDLGAPMHVQSIDLLPYQVPTPALTKHRVWVGNSVEELQLVQEISVETCHHAWLSGVPVEREVSA